ncbi:MAG TPA: hypothetical protein VI653_31045, partial [Steroidobacteraceae bacterium]
MRRLIRSLSLGCLAVVLVSCRGGLDGPEDAAADPAFEFLDGGHNGGNPHFFFLPPLVAAPSPSGTFDPSQSPTVTVCRLSSSACPVVARFSRIAGTGSEVIRVDVPDQEYVVNWHSNRCVTGSCTFGAGTVLRVSVAVLTTELGHADAQVVASAQKATTVNRSRYYPVVAGQTVPIAFRIEQGAVFVVGPSPQAQTIQTAPTPAGSSVQLTLPANALTQSTGVTVLPSATVATATGLVGGTSFDFGPTGTTFRAPVTIVIHYDPGHIPGSVLESRLRLYTEANGHWLLVPGSTVNVTTHTVSGVSGHFSTYAVLGGPLLTAFGGHVCELSASAPAVCWGNNTSGELGTGDISDRTLPTPVQGGPSSFASLSAGEIHTCGLAVDGTAWCWGHGLVGELGNNQSAAGSWNPVQVVGPPSTFRSLGSGFLFSCGLTDAGAAYCWGQNDVGQLGAGPGLGKTDCGGVPCSAAPVPVAGNHTFSSLSLGFYHACGLTTAPDVVGQVWCWGLDDFGQLGDGNDGTGTDEGQGGPFSDVPVQVIGGHVFASVSVGGSHSCALDDHNQAWCWGWNRMGQLGNGNPAQDRSSQPVPVNSGLAFASLTAGEEHTCGVVEPQGQAYCWGGGSFGQLGVNSTAPSAAPRVVVAGLTFGGLTAGDRFTCGITTGNAIYCWGLNDAGQLGNGTTTWSLIPV